MTQNFRHSEIIDILRREGRATVETLAEHFGVAVQTIRRDLNELGDSGKVERVHGGAKLPTSSAYIGYEERQILNTQAKYDIARTLARRIPNNCAIFLNIGTTIEALAAALIDHQNLLVVTNNMNVARILAANTSLKTIVTGGELRASDGGLTGRVTTDCIQQFKFDYGLIGCSALDLDGDVMEFDIQEAAVTQAIIARSRTVFLAADNEKFQRSAPARIGSLADIDALFTDKAVASELEIKFQRWGTELVIAS